MKLKNKLISSSFEGGVRDGSTEKKNIEKSN